MIEGIAVALAGALLGAGVMKLLMKIKKIERLVDRSENKKYEAIGDPEILLKKLNENGIMVDDGDKISFSIEEKDGRKQLVQTISKNAVASGSPTIKTIMKKKAVKKNGKTRKKAAK